MPKALLDANAHEVDERVLLGVGRHQSTSEHRRKVLPSGRRDGEQSEKNENITSVGRARICRAVKATYIRARLDGVSPPIKSRSRKRC